MKELKDIPLEIPAERSDAIQLMADFVAIAMKLSDDCEHSADKFAATVASLSHDQMIHMAGLALSLGKLAQDCFIIAGLEHAKLHGEELTVKEVRDEFLGELVPGHRTAQAIVKLLEQISHQPPPMPDFRPRGADLN